MVKNNNDLVPDTRYVSKKKLALVLFLTVAIFTFGLLVGNFLTVGKLNDILSVDREARLQLESIDLEEKLLSNIPCTDPALLSSNLNDLGVKIAYLETEYDKDDPQILELKKPYTLLEIRHYLKLKEIVDSCGKNYTLVLFFYSNDLEKRDLSEQQGFVLEYLQKKYTPDKIKVYSFDADLDMDIMRSFKSIYGVQDVPGIVINGKTYTGFHDKSELESIITSNSN